MSNFVVSARKYRPVRFDEVVGQEHVSKTLKNALQNDHLAHAFLFCGPRGVGKTTCARILAKVLNCQNLTEDHEACDECSSCQSFNDSASFNITELDAASNNSVEHIRALIEQVRFQPQQGQYKVFIIDEVHMLSSQAFNAFLKTLEEPPPYAIFILATTEKHKIIPTILSRCQIFDFRRIQVSAMVSHLKNICAQENIEAEEAALHVIAQKADGALRDSLSIFDRIVSGVAKNEEGKSVLTYKDVINSLNVLDYEYFFRVVDALLAEDMAQVMLIFDEVQRNGFEADTFMLGLAEHVRNVLVCKDQQTLPLLEMSEDLKARYQKQAALSSGSFLLTLLNLANDCDVNYRMARNKKLHVEMTLLKMTFANRAITMSPQALPAQAPVEKKTANLTATAKAPVATVPITSTPVPKAEIKSSTPVAKEPEVKMVVSEPKLETTKEQPKEIVKSQLTDDLRVSSKHNFPKLSSLDALDKEIDDEGPDEEIDLNKETLQAAWVAYTKTLESPTTRMSFQKALLDVEGRHILAKVGSPMSKSMIQEESSLMPFLRKELKNNKLVLNVTVDSGMSPSTEPKDQQPKAFTVKDKYEAMRAINPLVDDLQKRFNLKPESK
ncbi:MAG: DNA polymerase III subunit gamma/tau [Saprospiraceae bacterium]